MLTAIVWLVAGCAGCSIDEVDALRVERPSANQPQVPPNIAAGCARFVLRVARGVATVERVRDSAGCQSGGLRLEVDALPAFNASTGTVRIPIVMRNLSGSPVIARARVRFDADSSRFLDTKRSGGGARPKVVAINYDSAATSGRSVEWRFDSLLASPEVPQVLMPNAVSRRRELVFSSGGWNEALLVTLAADASTFPAVAPDSTPTSWISASSIERPKSGFPYVRGYLLVGFRLGTDPSERARVVARLGGTVAGGYLDPRSAGGLYLIRIPRADAEDSLVAAESRLRMENSVRYFERVLIPRIDATDPPSTESGVSTANWRRISPPPDSLPSGFYDDSNLVVVPELGHLQVVRNAIAVFFKIGTTDAEKAVAFDRVGGTVVGGSRIDDTNEGNYVIRLAPDPSRRSLVTAIAVLQANPRVAIAMPISLIPLHRDAMVLKSQHDPSSGRSLLSLCRSCDRDLGLLQALVPVPPPDSVPIADLQAFRADSNITHDDAPEMSGRYARNVVLVIFQPSATQRERTEMLRRVRGTVLGGFGAGNGGMYYVRIDGPRTTKHLFEVIAILKASPLVRLAVVDLLDPISPTPVRN